MPRSKNPMRSASPALVARRREYSKRNKVFAALPENRYCPVAESGLLGEPRQRRATDTHHKHGREGRKLLDFDLCIRVSRDGHDWIRDHGNEARKRGWLI